MGRYGYREGVRRPVKLPVDSSTSAISAGDMLIMATAGYVKKISAGDIPIGVAMEDCSVPGADGDLSILVDVSEDSIYEFPPDSGTVTAGLAQLTCDTGGAQSIDIDASTDDCIVIQRVDTTANTVFVSLKHVYSGVV